MRQTKDWYYLVVQKCLSLPCWGRGRRQRSRRRRGLSSPSLSLFRGHKGRVVVVEEDVVDVVVVVVLVQAENLFSTSAWWKCWLKQRLFFLLRTTKRRRLCLFYIQYMLPLSSKRGLLRKSVSSASFKSSLIKRQRGTYERFWEKGLPRIKWA